MKGDHLTVSRRYYTHHGIDLGDGRVVHYHDGSGNAENAEVVISPRAAFAAGGKIRVRRYKSAVLSPDETIQRALSRVGERGYNLMLSNCEHFATWCKTGEARSAQAENPKRTVNAALDAVARDMVDHLNEGIRILGEGIHCEPKPRKSSRRSS